MACSSQGAGRRPAEAGRWLLWAAVGLLGAGGAPARAAEIETRDFKVFIEGKPAGDAHMTIERQGDVAKMRFDTDIQYKAAIVYTYRYRLRGQEVWKGGRLQRLDSTCYDDGKNFVVSAVAGEGGLRLRVNSNPERVVRGDAWLTSYWSLPDKKVRAGMIQLIDADTGRDFQGRLQHVGAEQRAVAGQNVNVNHYRLITAGQPVELWYDGGERLVRQEWVEDGRRVIVELARVRR